MTRRFTVLLILTPGAPEPALALARELERAVALRDGALVPASTASSADALIEIQSVGPAGYRAGAQPGSRVYFGCMVLARMTSPWVLATEIEQSDVSCPEAARGLLFGIESLLLRDEGTKGKTL